MSRSRTALAAAAAALALSSTPAVAAPANEANDFPFPGADTIALHDGSGRYASFGASAAGRKVPYAVHGSGTNVGSSGTIAGDALPGGGGAWAARGSGIWTPGAFYAKHRYFLFYTATKANSGGRKCVGVASSTQPFSGYAAAPTPLVCPTKGDRWAIDADVTHGPKRGGIWMTWRDGQRALGKESALSAMRLQLGRDGGVRKVSRPRVLLRSNALTWAHFRDSGVTVIENPSAFYNAGSWYLFYSGNDWRKNFYSTGIAYCGARLNRVCTPMPGPGKAYFSYSGPAAHLKPSMRRYGLPGNKRGPGAMDVYRARGGQPWVTWNYLSNAGGRKSRTGQLIVTGTGAGADFKVR